MKNEYIRKHSNIKREEEEEDIVPEPESKKTPKNSQKHQVKERTTVAEPTQLDAGLEEIIGSLKDDNSKPKKVSKKAKGKKTTNKKIKTGDTPKTMAQINPQANKEKTTKTEKSSSSTKVIDVSKEDIGKEAPKQTSRKESQIETLIIDEVEEKPPIKIYDYDSLTIEYDYIEDSLKHLLQDVYFIYEEDFTTADWFLASSLYPLDEKVRYAGILLDNENIHTKLHVVPLMLSSQGSKSIVFSAYNPFGLKQKRNSLNFKHKVSGEEFNIN